MTSESRSPGIDNRFRGTVHSPTNPCSVVAMISPTLLTRDPARLEEAGFSDYPAGHAEGFPDSFKMLYRAIYAEIASRRDGRIDPRPLFATFADGHEQVVLGEAILRSHRERRWVELP